MRIIFFLNRSIFYSIIYLFIYININDFNIIVLFFIVRSTKSTINIHPKKLFNQHIEKKKIIFSHSLIKFVINEKKSILFYFFHTCKYKCRNISLSSLSPSQSHSTYTYIYILLDIF